VPGWVEMPSYYVLCQKTYSFFIELIYTIGQNNVGYNEGNENCVQES